MKVVGFRGASARSWRIGGILATMHLAAVLAAILALSRGSHDAGWQLAFIPFMLVDLPVLPVAYPAALGVIAVLGRLGVGLGDYGADYLLVGIANGLFGSLLYLSIPPALSAHRRFRKAVAWPWRCRRPTRACSGLQPVALLRALPLTHIRSATCSSMASRVKPLTFNGRAFRFAFPEGWGVEVSADGVVFLGPRGERATLDDSTSGETAVSLAGATESGETSEVVFTAAGPRPVVAFRCAGPVSQDTAEALIQSLRQIEWFPPPPKRRWWKRW